MEARVVNKGQLPELLDKLAKDYDLIAPVQEETMVLFKKVSGAGDAFLEYTNSDVSPKGCFLPQNEKTFNYTYTGDSIEINKPEDARKAVLFGARPCDIKAITTLDPVFDGEKFGDEYYSGKRENTVIIGLSCAKVLSTCFCYAFEGGPCDGTGSDLLFTEIGDKYYVEVFTDKGKALADAYSQIFSKGGEQLAKDKEELAKKLAGEFVRKVDLTGVKELMDNNFELPYWNGDDYKKCIGCGTCTYVCPTCHCFDIFDYPTGDFTGARLRCWDSCMYPEYTLCAGGHNPRPTRKERVRNRFMHKIKYHLDRYNMVGCVGCGRCVRKCPVNIDITKIINDLKEVAQNG